MIAPPPTTKPGIRAAYKIESMPSQILPEAKRIKITYGPFKLRGTEVSNFLSKRLTIANNLK
jgi:hypothetical protein